MARVRHRTSRARLALDISTEMLLTLGPPRLHDAAAETERLRVIWREWGHDLMISAEPDEFAWAIRTFGDPR